tara:strand:- start:1059 stop:2330 length:1272 start_codon:yes stop_codon:yes gene_type:complete
MAKPTDAISYLLSKERVMDLVEDIAAAGMTNPMDLIGVVERKGAGGHKTYISAEGNRRVCALQLLHDPEKVPLNYPGRRKIVERLEARAREIDLTRKISVCLFKSKKGAKPWIDRMHNTESKGTRRRWRPDQQERAMGGGRNRDALAIMDLAQEYGLIDQEQREQKLTTVQRYVGNPAFRMAFGLQRAGDKSLQVIRDPGDFEKLFRVFIEDAKEGKLSSRSSADDVAKYASKKVIETGISQKTCDPSPLSKALNERNPEEEISEDDSDVPNLALPETPVVPLGPLQQRKTVGFNADVVKALNNANIDKLSSLYRSCCELHLSKNGPLITVGWWSILESLSQLHGGKPFRDYLSKDHISKLLDGITKDRRNEIWTALDYISVRGNSTKHSALAGSFDGLQVANNIDIINPLVVKLLETLPDKQ